MFLFVTIHSVTFVQSSAFLQSGDTLSTLGYTRGKVDALEMQVSFYSLHGSIYTFTKSIGKLNGKRTFVFHNKSRNLIASAHTLSSHMLKIMYLMRSSHRSPNHLDSHFHPLSTPLVPTIAKGAIFL